MTQTTSRVPSLNLSLRGYIAALLAGYDLNVTAQRHVLARLESRPELAGVDWELSARDTPRKTILLVCHLTGQEMGHLLMELAGANNHHKQTNGGLTNGTATDRTRAPRQSGAAD